MKRRVWLSRSSTSSLGDIGRFGDWTLKRWASSDWLANLEGSYLMETYPEAKKIQKSILGILQLATHPQQKSDIFIDFIIFKVQLIQVVSFTCIPTSQQFRSFHHLSPKKNSSKSSESQLRGVFLNVSWLQLNSPAPRDGWWMPCLWS